MSHAGSRAWKYSSGWKKVAMVRALMRRMVRMWRKRRRRGAVPGGGLGMVSADGSEMWLVMMR